MENDDQLDLIFTALAERKRRRIMEELSEHPRTVGHIAEACGLRISAASKHISLLEDAGILYKSKRGRTVYCHINFDIWRLVAGHIAMHARFWNNRLDALERHIQEMSPP